MLVLNAVNNCLIIIVQLTKCIVVGVRNMKKEKKENSLKRGKGNKEEGPSRSQRDPKDLGDPRGSRAPRKETVNLPVEEKGDKKRIKNK